MVAFGYRLDEIVTSEQSEFVEDTAYLEYFPALNLFLKLCFLANMRTIVSG